MSDFKKGDMVRLKSGGPIIMVKMINMHGDLFCVWFNAIGEYQERAIAPYVVVKIDKIEAIHEIKNVNEQFDLIMLKKEDE